MRYAVRACLHIPNNTPEVVILSVLLLLYIELVIFVFNLLFSVLLSKFRRKKHREGDHNGRIRINSPTLTR